MDTIPFRLSERQARARLRALVLKDQHVHCQWCHSRNLIFLKKEDRYHCKKCRKKTSLFAGTWFRSIKIPVVLFINILVAWINGYQVSVAAATLTVSEVTIRRYYRLFRINIAKEEVFEPKICVQVDEAYFGQFKKQANYFHGVRTYKVVDKVCVAGIACPSTGKLFARVIRSIPKGAEIRAMIREQVPPNVKVYADGSYIYTRLDTTHRIIQQTHDLGFHNAWFIESCWAWMKRKLFRMYHHFDRKHAEEYVAELTWRFNHRKSSKNPWDILQNSL